MGTLNSMQISNAQDIWFWKHDSTGIFSVRSVYLFLERARGVEAAPSAVPGPVLAK
ncbi:hypothetical protein A2U01_0060584, partial [Trifolium medium]|nr:hypothetical protein [Trifolium medium]